jgi:hypothetical protein
LSEGSCPGDAAETAALVLAIEEFVASVGVAVISAPGECCIAGADGQSWPCRSAWRVAFGSGSLVELEWLDEVVACNPKQPRDQPPRQLSSTAI